MSDNARIDIRGKSVDLPIVEGSEGELGLDISKLRAQSKTITLDPGYVNTGACTSAITFLDGEEGILHYRGYSIEELAEHSNFLEVSYLLIYGDLPTVEQLEEFRRNITMHTMLHEDLRHIYEAFPKDAHPMAILSCIVCALSTFYDDFSHRDQSAVDLAVWRLVGKLPTIAAWSYKKNIGQPFVYPKNHLDYCANFLNMMFSVPAGDYEVPEVFAKALNVLFILHADHEQNCSTSTVRLVGSSQANLFASISSGIAALWGPLHGGANEKVVSMLEKIDSKEDIRPWLDETLKAKNVVWGMGHREYSVKDPRANILTDMVQELFKEREGGVTDIFEKAIELEKACEEKLAHKGVYPNVDFYSGILYKEMDIPTDIFTPIFAMSRVSGWLAHWIEQIQDNKIFRPTQNYVGSDDRAYKDITDR